MALKIINNECYGMDLLSLTCEEDMSYAMETRTKKIEDQIALKFTEVPHKEEMNRRIDKLNKLRTSQFQ